MGIDTGPIERKGWPKARTELPSTQVTVPVADRSMSPERSCVATAEPGASARGLAAAVSEDGAPLPEGTVIQLAASAILLRSRPGPSLPPKETGSGSAAMESGTFPRKGLSSSSKRSANPPPANAERKEAVDTAAPEIGTGGAGGAWRMSSMLWIGVIPQIGSLEKGHP